MTTIPLPPLLREIADVAGSPAAEAMARAHGGARVYIPAGVDAEHWLAALVGHEVAQLLCGHFGGRTIDVPHGPWRVDPARAEIDRLLREGVSTYEIARRTGVSARSVRRIKAGGAQAWTRALHRAARPVEPRPPKGRKRDDRQLDLL